MDNWLCVLFQEKHVFLKRASQEHRVCGWEMASSPASVINQFVQVPSPHSPLTFSNSVILFLWGELFYTEGLPLKVICSRGLDHFDLEIDLSSILGWILFEISLDWFHFFFKQLIMMSLIIANYT